MRRLLLVPLSVALLAALAGAGDTPARPAAERARMLQRNRPLIEHLVAGGLGLAEEKDALRRADRCNDLARHLAEQIDEAAGQNDAARAAELGQHLQQLLEQGVAANLSEARGHIPAGSAEEKQLVLVHDRAKELLGPLEERLQGGADPRSREDLRRAHDAVHAGRARVESAIQGAKARDPGRQP